MRGDWGGGIRWDAHVRDGYRCVYCGLDGAVLKRWDLFTNDHLVPEATGGPYTLFNVVTACLGCNQIKSGFDPTDKGLDPLTEESRNRLISRAKEYIEAHRKEWEADFQEMLREAQRL